MAVKCKLVRGAICSGCGGERDYLPFAVFLVETEEIPAAVIELAVYVEIKGRPDDGQVVVDLDLRIVNAFFDVCGSGGRYAIGPKLDCELAQDTILHDDENSAGQPGSLDGGRIAMRHAVEHGLCRSKDSLFVLSRPATAKWTKNKADYRCLQMRSYRDARRTSKTIVFHENTPHSEISLCRMDTMEHIGGYAQAVRRGIAIISSINRRMQCFAVRQEWRIALN